GFDQMLQHPAWRHAVADDNKLLCHVRVSFAAHSAAHSAARASDGAGSAAWRSIFRMAKCIQAKLMAIMAKSSMKQLDQIPVTSLSAPKTIGKMKPPSPPIMPTRPPTAPTLCG